MIINACLGIMGAIIQLIVNVRPPWSLSLPNSVTLLLQSIGPWDGVLPITETVTCGVGFLSLWTALTGWKWLVKLIDWIADIIP